MGENFKRKSKEKIKCPLTGEQWYEEQYLYLQRYWSHETSSQKPGGPQQKRDDPLDSTASLNNKNYNSESAS